MAVAKTTTDHGIIRRWAEERGGRPARVKVKGADDSGTLRLDFGERDPLLQEITWDEFFEKFDEGELTFLYEEDAASEEEPTSERERRPDTRAEHNTKH